MIKVVSALVLVLVCCSYSRADGEITLVDAWSPDVGVVKGDGNIAGWPPPAGLTVSVRLVAQVGATKYDSLCNTGGGFWNGTTTGVPSGATATVYANMYVWKNGVVIATYSSNTKSVLVK